MSWDVSLFKEKYDLKNRTEDIAPLGDRASIIPMLTSLLPEIDYSDPTWGVLESVEYSIEFNTGSKDPIDGIMLHIRGGGDPLVIIKLICEHTGWGALDTSTGEFMDTDHLSQESWIEFQKFRDRVMGR